MEEEPGFPEAGARAMSWLLRGVVLLVSAAHLLAALGSEGVSALAMGAMGALCLTCLPHLRAARCNLGKSALQLMLMSAAMAVIHLLWIGMPGMEGHGHGAHAGRGPAGEHGAAMLGLVALELLALATASAVLRHSHPARREPAAVRA
ncbi:hypothetical protein ACSYDW_05600 [Paeniglutamicibacter sp. R2-26]|uniref:hypothetical protein n=1 Tax=Paeniglutamicibacter sp. R2-26 TaxID=3144417 RepID=UPI003EE70EF2